MHVEVAEPGKLADRVATRIAHELRTAAKARGGATLALSGGTTPTTMLASLAALDVPWSRVHVLQVDERVAPDGDEARNLTGLRAVLLDRVDLPPDHIHPMPVGGLDPDDAAVRYAATLRSLAGAPAVLDVVQLGLGDDGHVASLVQGDPVLEEVEREVVATGSYRGHRRVTLTRPVLDRARRLVWMVAGSGKAAAVRRLRAGDRSIPAGLVRTERAELHIDQAAAGLAS